METVSSAAAAGFDRLAQQYLTPGIFEGSFWHGGNALHTCLDYLSLAKHPDNHNLLGGAYDIYTSMVEDPGWWKDDFGWWGIAFVTAINERAALGYSDPAHDHLFTSLRSSAHDCFESLCANWSDTAYGDDADIRGGVFNTTANEQLAGRNSVTNEGFWLLSMGLAALEPEEHQYADKAQAEQRWFAEWLQLPNTNGGNGILTAEKLVRERPLGNPADPDWHWSGDQGLFMAAQSESGQAALASDVAGAVIENMTDRDQVLHEYMGFQQAGYDGFTADYATGKGVCMRWLARLNQQLAGHPYSDFIATNARAVWSNQLGDAQFAFNWNPGAAPDAEPSVLDDVKKGHELFCHLIMQAAGQDALNAALRAGSGDGTV